MKLFFAAVLAMMSLALPAQAGGPLRVTIKNGSQLTISDVHVVIAGRDDWGKERLNGKSIAPKGKHQVLVEDGADKCVLDVRIRVSEGKEFDYRVVFCQERTFTFRGRL